MLPLLVRIMVQLQLLLLLLLMLPLSTRITLSLLFSVSISPSLGRSTMPIWWLSFLLVRPLSRVLLCTLLNPLPIQLHFLCHGGSRCIRIPRDSANVLTICERRTHMDSLASLHSCLWFCYGSPVAWTKARARARTRAASPSTQGCHVDHEHIDIMLHLMRRFLMPKNLVVGVTMSRHTGNFEICSAQLWREVIFTEESIRAKSYFMYGSLTIPFH